MVHTLIVVLTCAAAVAASSYADYSGLKMPQYGGAADYDLGRDPPSHPSDDYHGHSPDAPASLDYKFEEKPRVKTDKPTKDTEELDVWRKAGNRQKELIRPVKSDNNMRHKYHGDEEDDEVPNFTTNRRYSKNRSRLRNDIDQTEEEVPVRRHNKYNRDTKDDISDIDRKEYLHLDKDYVPEDKNKEFDEDVKFFREVTTKRPIRRRPREKDFKRRQSEDEYVDENWSDFTMKTEKDNKYIPRLNEEIRRQRPPELRIGPTREHERERSRERDHERDRERQRTRFQPGPDEEEDARMDPIKVISGKFKPKAYDEYDDYYDMKRVQSIKSKLPSLLMRRTTVRARNLKKTPSRVMKKMSTKQHKSMTKNSSVKLSIETTTDDFDTITTQNPMVIPFPLMNFQPSKIKNLIKLARTRSTVVLKSQKTTKNRETTYIRQTTTAQHSTITDTIYVTFPHMLPTLWPDERSKDFILKKVRRKEGIHFVATKKPPVLLLVSKHIPTVVMVEAHSSTHIKHSDQKLFDDSPEIIMRVKRLMRRKLIANAKNVQELVGSWDDEDVCDYIDMALVTSDRGLAITPAKSLFYLQLFVNMIIIFTNINSF